MVSLSQGWFNTASSIASELASQAGEAFASLGRWLGDSAKESEPRLLVATVILVTALAVGVAILLSTVIPVR